MEEPLKKKTTFKMKSCCFFLNLTTGALTIGYLNIIFVVFGLFGTFKGFGYLEVIKALLKEETNNTLEASDAANAQREEIKSTIVTIELILYTNLLLLLCSGTMAVVLILGVHQRKPSYLDFYWICTAVLDILFMIMEFIYIHSHPKPDAVRFLIILIILVLKIYFVLIVRSAAIEIREETENIPLRNMGPGNFTQPANYAEAFDNPPSYMGVDNTLNPELSNIKVH